MNSELTLLWILLIIAIFIVIYGVLMIVAPNVIFRMSERMDKSNPSFEISIFYHRRIWGTVFLVLGSYLFFIAYNY
ncbi:MAG: hypothetical protein IIB95_04965 [Candidatus Marinimicrobia bacterium]|nr:hypothetical protein [Candidatus Neomarinimicrobiota bacterium]MCH7763077.1 hypothetical protein [Candidatus Neomarinimicrobiota bacterium]